MTQYRIEDETVERLALTAAVLICADPELGVTVGGVDGARQSEAVDRLAAIIRETFVAGLAGPQAEAQTP